MGHLAWSKDFFEACLSSYSHSHAGIMTDSNPAFLEGSLKEEGLSRVEILNQSESAGYHTSLTAFYRFEQLDLICGGGQLCLSATRNQS